MRSKPLKTPFLLPAPPSPLTVQGTGHGRFGQFIIQRFSSAYVGEESLPYYTHGRQFSSSPCAPVLWCGSTLTRAALPKLLPRCPSHRQSVLPQLLQHGSLFHGGQSSRDRLLQPGSRAPLSTGSPTGSQPSPGIHQLQYGHLPHGL